MENLLSTVAKKWVSMVWIFGFLIYKLCKNGGVQGFARPLGHSIARIWSGGSWQTQSHLKFDVNMNGAMGYNMYLWT